MEKYFKSYKEAADYVVSIVLKEYEKKVIQIEKLQMNNKEYFYKLTVEPYILTVESYGGTTNSHSWTTQPISIIADLNAQSPLVLYDTKDNSPTKTGYEINWKKEDITTGYNPYQE